MSNDNTIRICEKSGKNCYSRRIANELVNLQKHHKKKNIRINKGKIPVRSYYCEFCKSYHLTSTPFHRMIRYDLEKRKSLKEIY